VSKTVCLGFVILALAGTIGSVGAETEVRTTMELAATAYRGKSRTWYFVGGGRADVRLASVGNDAIKAEAAVEFYPLDITGAESSVEAETPAVDLKRLWLKANFPSWRLTAGKTKLAWGNGFVFNSGDLLFGSLGPAVDFTQSTVRDDTAFLTAFNIPTGRFSYIEGVLLPPKLSWDGTELEPQTIEKSSGGLRAFGRLGGWRLEGGYLYKGDAKTAYDLLGHRGYVSVHGHAGVDLYGAASFAAGYDGSAGVTRDSWDEVKSTVNLSLGAFHQLAVGYDGTLSLRFEALVMPWQNWDPVPFDDLGTAGTGYYGLMLYPEVVWTIRSTWNIGLRALVSPIDASAQFTASAGWDVFRGFSLTGYLVMNAGRPDSLYAWDRSSAWPAAWTDSVPNGAALTLGGSYRY